MASASLASIPRVAEAALFRGAAAQDGAPPDLVVEVPHGATTARHFDDLVAELEGPFAANLRDFYFVNTDVGAPEVATLLGARVTQDDPRRAVLVIRALVPRTFIDLNRVIASDAAGAPSRAGAVTPGVMPWVRAPRDLALLHARYAAYRDLVTRAVDAACAAGGTALFLHSYAPREVDVPVDERIVERLHEAYGPDRVGTWALRPPIDLITRTPEGETPADEGFAAHVREACQAAGLEVATSRAYGLHPATMAASYAARHPGRTLCLEMRRDLLVAAFSPFAEMAVDPERAGRLARLLARAWLLSR